MRRTAALLLTALLAACAPDPRTPEERPDVAPPPSPQLPSEGPGLSKGGTAFAVELYGRLGARPGNVFVSPVSLTTAFGMAYLGAEGETAAEIARTLRYDLPADQLHAALGGMQGRARLSRPDATLSVANALWAQDGLPILPGYAAAVNRDYAGALRRVDFRRPEAAAGAINAWVEAQTNNRIQGLVEAADLDAGTSLILVNTVYMKADWRRPFQKAATRVEPFRTGPGESRPVPLMRQQGEFRYLDGGSFHAVRLPYSGEELSMLIFLPKAADGLPAWEAALTPANLERWSRELAGAEPRDVAVTLPRFTVQARYKLIPDLRSLGIRRAFSPQAEFTGMARDARFYLDDVVQQTFLAVDEAGTEAAAATYGEARPVSPPPPPVEFRADHPFFFVIRDERSGALLFLGRLQTPG